MTIKKYDDLNEKEKSIHALSSEIANEANLFFKNISLKKVYANDYLGKDNMFYFDILFNSTLIFLAYNLYTMKIYLSIHENDSSIDDLTKSLFEGLKAFFSISMVDKKEGIDSIKKLINEDLRDILKEAADKKGNKLTLNEFADAVFNVSK